MHPHFSGNMSQDPMAISQLNTKHGIGESLYYRALNLYDIFFSHVSNSLLASDSKPLSKTSYYIACAACCKYEVSFS